MTGGISLVMKELDVFERDILGLGDSHRLVMSSFHRRRLVSEV